MIDPFAESDPPPSDPTQFPADRYLELALLGKILLDQNLDGLDFLWPAAFYVRRHGEIFQRMRDLWNAGIGLDPVLISDRDDELYGILCNAQDECLRGLGTPAIHFARQVVNLAQKRNMIPLLGKAAELSYNGAGFEDVRNLLLTEMEKRQPLSSSGIFDRWQSQVITGEQAAELGAVERGYLVNDFIRDKSVSVLYGAPGEFKSALAMDMALCIGNGVPWLQRLPVEGNTQPTFATRQCRVLWLNYDQGRDDVIERLGAMSRVYGGGANVSAISHSAPPAVLQNEQQARGLGEWCAIQGYQVVIVDSLLDIKGKADLQEAAMGDVLGSWRLVAEVGNLSVIIIAHNTKQSLDLYGSQFIKAKVDHLYYVSRPPGTEVAVVESKKQRAFGEQMKLYARWCWTHFEGTRTLQTARFFGDSTQAGQAATSLSSHATTQDAILKILMDSPGRAYRADELHAIVNEGRAVDDELTLNAVRIAVGRSADHHRSVGKTALNDRITRYHYGDLTTSDGESGE